MSTDAAPPDPVTLSPGPEGLRRILRETKTVAMVGVSPNPVRPSNYVGRYLALKGIRVVPVNPVHAGKRLFGEEVSPSLADIPEEVGEVDMVDIFRRSDQAGAVVDEALETLGPRGLRTVWMQIGVSDCAAAERAQAAGVEVVMNLCPKMEYQRLFGELRMGGINTGVISSKRR
jgi:predicted CoA-binding protein